MNKEDNDLFFICSFIEYIARKTNNTKKYIVETIGEEKLKKIYDLADIYHSENIEKITDEIIEYAKIEQGNYNILKDINNSNPPTYFDMGKVYQRLISSISKDKNDYLKNMIEVLTSWIILKLDNYDSSLYYENPSYILACYKEGKILN